MKSLVISASLNPDSRSRIMARHVFEALPAAERKFLDLRDYPLPLCDGGAAYGAANVKEVHKLIAEADLLIVGFPVYNFSYSAALKNLVELTGKAWENKVVGFVSAAGGKFSYMSVMSIANALMLDFRCLVVPRFVYCDGDAFAGDELKDEAVARRLQELAGAASLLAETQSKFNRVL